LVSLPLPSLRLMTSPLQLTYSYIWQVVRQKKVKQYPRVEEFVSMVTQTVPELMSFKQTAQLILGLRARIILDMLQRDGPPDSKAIQTLINKLKIDGDVEKSQTNFMVLVQSLLKSPSERKRFFQEVFPVQYGTKFDTALQTLIAGLVCKLEQLLPVPNLSQVYTSASISDTEDLGVMTDDSDSPAPPAATPQRGGRPPQKAASESAAKETRATRVAQSESLAPGKTSVEKSSTHNNSVSIPESKDPSAAKTPEKAQLQQLSMKSIPFRVVSVPAKPDSTPQNAGTKDGQKTQRVTLHQWVSQIATNSLSLPALPPLPPPRLIGGYDSKPSIRRKKQIRPPSDRYSCSVCDKSFPYQSKLTDHERIHTGEKPFVCSACNKSFRTQAFLNNHLKTHSSMRPYVCGQCGKCFTKLQSLTKHMLAHSGQKPFYCNICNKGFTQSTYFKRHMECHTSQMTFPCKHCTKVFPTAFKLSNHERWHTRDRPHMCERCGKRFLVPSLLKRHMGYHIGDRQYLCSQCGKTFVYLSDLKRHQLDHIPKAKIPCPVCQKKFSSKYCLRVHLRIHTRERPYRCTICEKTFTQVGNLKVHIRLHTNERPYSCDVCGKTYKLASHLNVHKRTHTCKKPWTCETCGKGFSVPGLLKKHEQMHAREANPEFAAKRRHRGKLKKPSLKRKYDEEDEASDDY
uniref:C2H2-type domain-containing protein n=1 Tax=Salarias fasciatus TaxID=181472 RepID=A0A672J4C8_SALFA